uniref:DUF4368 domain-containing protein n=1 Tax=Parabacteroides goldsteinii TaxID=328812 RepID=UPI002614D685
LADRYSDLQELDASTVNELIDRIVIHSPERIGGRKHVIIEIYFTYVGKIRIPLYKPDIPTDIENQRDLRHAGFTGNFIYFLNGCPQKPDLLLKHCVLDIISMPEHNNRMI